MDVPHHELHNILDIARGCARYPRLRFILVADHVDLPMRGQLAADMAAGLSAGGGFAVLERIGLLFGGVWQEGARIGGDGCCTIGRVGELAPALAPAPCQAHHPRTHTRGAPNAHTRLGVHAGGSGWPDNTLLYLGASSSSTITYSDPVTSRFGLLVTTAAFDEGWKSNVEEPEFEEWEKVNDYTDERWKRANQRAREYTEAPPWKAALGELVGRQDTGGAAAGGEGGMVEAVEWARRHGGLTLRTAALYARLSAGKG